MNLNMDYGTATINGEIYDVDVDVNFRKRQQTIPTYNSSPKTICDTFCSSCVSTYNATSTCGKVCCVANCILSGVIGGGSCALAFQLPNLSNAGVYSLITIGGIGITDFLLCSPFCSPGLRAYKKFGCIDPEFRAY